jgi:hypothetical protein
MWLSSASARMLRAELWVHKNSTLMGGADMVGSLGVFDSLLIQELLAHISIGLEA